jgi:hypothetical protein
MPLKASSNMAITRHAARDLLATDLEAVLLQVRGFKGGRWWVWVAMAVLASGIVILNVLTAVLNHIMPRERP